LKLQIADEKNGVLELIFPIQTYLQTKLDDFNMKLNMMKQNSSYLMKMSMYHQKILCF